MARNPYTAETRGSQKDLQLLANEHQNILNEKLSGLLKRRIKLCWKSPLKNDDYAEYSDNDFIRCLGIHNTSEIRLDDFWPRRGANWDGLAVDGETVFLIEAKAHLSEQISGASHAEAEASIEKIDNAFFKVKEYLNVPPSVSWRKSEYYQFANRIAHLYFLRKMNGMDAHLLMIYFLNDKIGKDETQKDWEDAIEEEYRVLQLEKNNNLNKYIHHIFIDVNRMK